MRLDESPLPHLDHQHDLVLEESSPWDDWPSSLPFSFSVSIEKNLLTRLAFRRLCLSLLSILFLFLRYSLPSVSRLLQGI